MQLLDIIACAERFNRRVGYFRKDPISDIFYDLQRGMVTLNFYDNMFSITFHKSEINNYTPEYVGSVLKEIVDKIEKGEITKESYYEPID